MNSTFAWFLFALNLSYIPGVEEINMQTIIILQYGWEPLFIIRMVLKEKRFVRATYTVYAAGRCMAGGELRGVVDVYTLYIMMVVTLLIRGFTQSKVTYFFQHVWYSSNISCLVLMSHSLFVVIVYAADCSFVSWRGRIL